VVERAADEPRDDQLAFVDDLIQRLILLEPAGGPAEPVQQQTLAFSHDSIGSFLVAVQLAEQVGASLDRPGRLDEAALAQLAPTVDELVDRSFRPETCELLLSIVETAGVTPDGAAWLDLFGGKLRHRVEGEHQAAAWYERALTGMRDPERRAWLSATLGFFHTIHTMDGRRALAYMHRAERYYLERGEREGVLGARLGVLLAAHRLGRFSEAVRRWMPADFESADPLATADRLLRLGILYRQNGNLERARELVSRAHDLLQAHGSPLALAEASIAFGDVLAGAGRWVEAIRRYEAALEVLAEQESAQPRGDYASRLHQGSAQLGLGRAWLLGLGEPGRAESHLASAEATMRALQVRPHLARALSLQAERHRRRGDQQAEYAALEEALELYRRGGERLHLVRTLPRLALLAARRRRFWPAVRYGRHLIAMVVRSPRSLLGGSFRRAR
jgi:tetratricopeptide (TPR) repeat protein